VINRAVKKMSVKKAELGQGAMAQLIFNRIFLMPPIVSIRHRQLNIKKKRNNQHVHGVFFLSKSQRSFSICGTAMSPKNESTIAGFRWDGNEFQGGNRWSYHLIIILCMVVSLSRRIDTALLKIVFYSQVHLYLYIVHFKATTTGDDTSLTII